MVAALAVAQYPFPFELDKDRKPALQTGGNCLIRGGRILTITKGVIEGGDILVRNGKIAEIGRNLTPPPGFKVIDAKGMVVMPGIVDTHVHRALDGTNEGSESITPEASVRMAINSEAKNLWQVLASGHTAGLLLHGSANAIGGESVVIKYKYRRPTRELPVPDAPRMCKFALGENVTRKNSGGGTGTAANNRFPRSRMGVEAVYRRAFEEAKAYRAKQRAGELVRKDVRLETLADILDRKVWVQCHSYRADEMLMMVRLSQEFGFKLNMQHALEAYKIAPEMAKAGVGCGMFFDNWAGKIEMYDGNPYNAAICQAAGVLVSINTDGTGGTTALNLEAAKAMRYGGVTEEQALKMLTINPAKQLGIDHRTGSIEVGKDADICLWSGHPLSVLSKPMMTLVEGEVFFTRRDAFNVDEINKAPDTLESYKYQPAPAPPKLARSYAITNARIYTVSGPVIERGTVVIEDGKIKAVGTNVAIPSGAVRIDGRGKRVYPGFIDGGSSIGLAEVSGIVQWVDNSEFGDYQPDLRAQTVLYVESAYFGTARASGVTHTFTKPIGGVIPGQAALVATDGYTTEELARYPDNALVLNLPGGGFAFPEGFFDNLCTDADDWASLGLYFLDGVLPPPSKHEHSDGEDMQGFGGQGGGQGGPGTEVIEGYLNSARAYLKNPTVPRNLRYEALRPYLEGKKPVVVRVRNAASIRSAVAFGKKNGLNLILAGADDAWKETELLKKENVPVLIPPAGKVCLSANNPVGELDPYDTPYVLPYLLAKAGVLFGFESGSNSEVQNLPFRVGQSCAYGLSYDDAVKALTLDAAKILGVDDRLGSIEVGKVADLIVTEGDPLGGQCNILYAFVEGKPASLESKHTKLRDRYLARVR